MLNEDYERVAQQENYFLGVEKYWKEMHEINRIIRDVPSIFVQPKNVTVSKNLFRNVIKSSRRRNSKRTECSQAQFEQLMGTRKD